MIPSLRNLSVLGRRRPDIAVIAAGAVFAVFGVLVLQLGSEVVEGEYNALDRAVLLWIRQMLGENGALRSFMEHLTVLGDTSILAMIVAAVTGLLIVSRQYRLAVLVPIECGAGILLVHLLKPWFDRPRPAVVEAWASYATASYPSGHAASACIVYFSLVGLLAGRIERSAVRLYLISLACLLCAGIGLSRLYLGVHWPTDVLAGWAFGSSWALLGYAVKRRLLGGE